MANPERRTVQCHEYLILALDFAKGELHFSDVSRPSLLHRVAIAGTGLTELPLDCYALPGSLALDAQGGKIHWSDLSDHRIRPANLDGTSAEQSLSYGDSVFVLAAAAHTPEPSSLLSLSSSLIFLPALNSWRRRRWLVHRGYRVTQYVDDRVVTCRIRREAEHVLREAAKILTSLGVELNRDKTRIVHVSHGFEIRVTRLYDQATDTSLATFVREASQWNASRRSLRDSSSEVGRAVQGSDSQKHSAKGSCQDTSQQLIAEINPVIRGGGLHHSKSRVRKLFNHLDRWIIQRLWSHRHRR